MDDYVEELDKDLRMKLDRLSRMRNDPNLHVANHFAELRKQIELDAERLLSEIQSVKRETGKARKDSDVNETRLEFIRILEELEKRTGLQSKPESGSGEVYASLEQRVEAFKDSSSSLGDLEEFYIQLAREIIDETDRVERRLLGEQTIIYWPHQDESDLGSLVYFGDIFLTRQQINRLMSQAFIEEDFLFERSDSSLLVPVRKPRELTKTNLIIESLVKCAWSRFGEASKFFYIGKTWREYSGYSAEGSSLEREFVSYQLTEIADILHISGNVYLDTSVNLFDLHSSMMSYELRISELRLESLYANLLPLSANCLKVLAFNSVHLDTIRTELLAKFSNLTELTLQVTFSKGVRFDLDFLRLLRRLISLELSLPQSPPDMGTLLQLTQLRDLKLNGTSYFYAKKRPRLSKAAIEQILSPPRLQTLKLSCFDIEIIDQNMLSKCNRLKTLTLAKNHIDRTIKDGSLNLGFPLCFGDSNMKAESAHDYICIKLYYNQIQSLSAASFAGMSCLKELSLTGNSIVDLPTGVFQDLTSLEHLDLDNNLIRHIRSGVFGKLDKLDTLNMDNNPIESIEANAFAQLTNLRELSLSSCRLKSIDSEMFVGLIELIKLKLDNNLIERIEVVTKDGRRINVAKADLNDEEKQLVKKHLFMDLSRLFWLDLSSNKLEKLDLNCFINLKLLYELDVSSNKINELSGEIGAVELRSLQELKLNNNELATIDNKAFPKTLPCLHLFKNRLKRLDDDFFAGFTKLRMINLAQNELTMTINDATFASCIQCLKEVDLSQNESICVTQGAFTEMLSLSRIECDFSENTAFMPILTTLRIRRQNPEVLEALAQKFCVDQPERFLNQLEVCCLSNCSIKYLTRKPEWQNMPDTSETGHINLSWLAKASRLKELDFSRNLIETLDDPNLFADFTEIKKINLSHNKLTNIHRNIFKCYSHLFDIDLSGNKFTSIDMGLFRHISTSLTRLNISSNNITFFNLARLFRTCPRLSYLNLADNHLDDRSIAEPIDARLSNHLRTLNLANNRLEKMDLVRDMINLTHLNLRGNRIDSVMSAGENLLGRLSQLTHLDLSDNRIRLLRDEMFAHFYGQLAHLDLSGNPVDFQLDSVLKELI